MEETKSNFMLNVVEALLDDFRHRGIKSTELNNSGLTVEFDNLGFLLAFKDIKEQWRVEKTKWGTADVYFGNDHIKITTHFSETISMQAFLEKVGLDYGKQDEENSVGD